MELEVREEQQEEACAETGAARGMQRGNVTDKLGLRDGVRDGGSNELRGDTSAEVVDEVEEIWDRRHRRNRARDRREDCGAIGVVVVGGGFMREQRKLRRGCGSRWDHASDSGGGGGGAFVFTHVLKCTRRELCNRLQPFDERRSRRTHSSLSIPTPILADDERFIRTLAQNHPRRCRRHL